MFDNLTAKFGDALKHITGQDRISEKNIEDALKDVRTALLEADVNFKVVRNFISAVKERALGENVIRGVKPKEQFVKIVNDELSKVMGEKNEAFELDRSKILPVLVVGLNGQGKTTFCGKLSYYLKNKKKDVLLVPADTFRPAAKEQLITLANNVGVEYFDSNLSLHPREIAIKAMEYAQNNNKSIVIIDTAGRLHVDDNLMQQIKEVRLSLEKYDPQVLMVADAMTGQEAVNVAQAFHEAVGLTGVVLSKMDSDARGGAALSIRYVTGVPISYISMGEKMADLELFHPDRMAQRILDMGDVLSLMEKAQEVIDEEHAENMMKKLQKGKFTIDDFIKQMDMISNLGPLEHILKMVPGMGKMLREVGNLGSTKNEMSNMKVIVSSMTKQERDDYTILNDSRITRIAKGSGKSVADVKSFLAKFKQLQGMMSSMGKMMGKGDNLNLDMNSMMSQMSRPKKEKRKGGRWGKSYF